MKKYIKDSQIIEKIKNVKVKPRKGFKKVLLNSLKEEYKWEIKNFSWQNFNLINIFIMNLKKVVAWILVIISIIGIMWAFNTSYAEKKENVFDYINSGTELIFVWINEIPIFDDFIKVANDKKFMKITWLSEKELKELKEKGSLRTEVSLSEKEIKEFEKSLETTVFIWDGESAQLSKEEMDIITSKGWFIEFWEVSDEEMEKMIKSWKALWLVDWDIDKLFQIDIKISDEEMKKMPKNWVIISSWMIPIDVPEHLEGLELTEKQIKEIIKWKNFLEILPERK